MFGGTSTPYTVLVSQTGKILYTHLGYVPGDEIKIEAEIVQLFGGTADGPTDADAEPAE